MLLREMWSAIGAPKDDQQEIDWLDDLKFFMDNDDAMLNKVYIRPIETCLDHYCEKYDIDDREKKFPKVKLIDLAKLIAGEQEKYLQKGDYD